MRASRIGPYQICHQPFSVARNPTGSPIRVSLRKRRSARYLISPLERTWRTTTSLAYSGGRKRALGTRALLLLPQGQNQRWSLDFLSDPLSDCRRFRILAVVDDFMRECLGLVADTSLSGTRVSRELDAIIDRSGKPLSVVSDNGTEFTSTAILHWTQQTELEQFLINLGHSRMS